MDAPEVLEGGGQAPPVLPLQRPMVAADDPNHALATIGVEASGTCHYSMVNIIDNISLRYSSPLIGYRFTGLTSFYITLMISDRQTV